MLVLWQFYNENGILAGFLIFPNLNFSIKSVVSFQHFNIMWEHCLQHEEFGPDGDLIAHPGETIRSLSPPKQWVYIPSIILGGQLCIINIPPYYIIGVARGPQDGITMHQLHARASLIPKPVCHYIRHVNAEWLLTCFCSIAGLP